MTEKDLKDCYEITIDSIQTAKCILSHNRVIFVQWALKCGHCDQWHEYTMLKLGFN